MTGVFGPPNTNLAGQNFTLIYTFNTTQGQENESCVNGEYESVVCESDVSGSPGGVLIKVGTGQYPDTSAGSTMRELFGYLPVTYAVTLTTDDTNISMEGAPANSPNFDWRTNFSAATIINQGATGEFTINDGINQASATLIPTGLNETGVSCTATSAELEINNDNDSAWLNYPQANILGGSLAGNFITTVNVAVSPSSSPLPVVSFADTDKNANNEAFSIGAIPDSSGDATMQYLTASSSTAVQNSLTGTMCNITSSPVKVYDFYPYLNKAQAVQFDIGLSQVDDTTFVNSAALSPVQLQKFFTKAKAGSLLARFYFDTTNPNNGGWAISAATGNQTNIYSGSGLPSATTYCELDAQKHRTICPLSGDQGELAAYFIIADTNGVNPEVIGATLQKESGMITNIAVPTTVPKLAAFDAAMGCGSGSFNTEIACGAARFLRWYNDTNPTYPYFFPVNLNEKEHPTGPITHSIQYAYSATKCDANVHTNCDMVGFWLSDAATYAQYKYTPFVQTQTTGSFGGFRSFEQFWFNYSNVGWYQ